MTMTQTSYMINQLTQNISPAIATSAIPPQPDESVWNLAYTLILNSQAAKDNRFAVTANKSATDSSAWRALSIFMDGNPGQAIVQSVIGESSGKPILLRMEDIGDGVVTASGVVLTAIGAYTSLNEESLIGKVAGLSGVKAATAGAIQPWVDMLMFGCQIIVGFFMMCSIYLPLIPFIVFMGQVLNWLITVVEGVAAAPFLAFAHFDTDGQGLGHKTQYGYTFMLSSFMRPVMLVLGFVFACILLEVIGGFVTNIFADVIKNAQIDSMTGLFKIFGFVAIFFVMMISLTNACMSVTYLLPDAIFQFIGAHNSATAQVGRHENENITRAAMTGTAVSHRQSGSMEQAIGGVKGTGDAARRRKYEGGGGESGGNEVAAPGKGRSA